MCGNFAVHLGRLWALLPSTMRRSRHVHHVSIDKRWTTHSPAISPLYQAPRNPYHPTNKNVCPCAALANKQDVKRATKVLDSACDGGLADSCNMLAKQLLRRDGKGPIRRDPPRAQALLEKGCSYNHGPSCYNLTVMLKNGDEGVPRYVPAVLPLLLQCWRRRSSSVLFDSCLF